MSQRHSRKRSSVTVVKKRFSQDKDSLGQGSSNTMGSPYPENNGEDLQTGHTSTLSTMTMSPECNSELVEKMTTTTRTEADLFTDDDEQLSRAPRIAAKTTESNVSPSVKVLAHIPNGESARYSEARGSSRGGSPSATTGGRQDTLKQKPLLSSSASRHGLHKGSLSASPSKGQYQSSPIRRMPQRGKRMSLNYISSPATPRLSEIDRSATMGFESATPSTVGTPGTSAPASSTHGYFGRHDLSDAGRMAVPMSASSTRSCSATSTSPNLSKMAKKEDGDTVMTQHKDLLARIAEKERKIFELRESLSREERELKKLQQTWQASVNQDLAVHQPGSTTGGEDVPTSAGLLGFSADSEMRRREMFQQPSVVAADGWKVLSATLAGAGTQINALIDQLATPIEADTKEAGKGTSIKPNPVPEKVESATVPPTTPAKQNTSIKKAADSEKVDKRTSMFGASMAALQKQVDAFSGIDSSIEATPKAAENAASGWGTWQKRLKEARENASGLLARAEQRLGQALVIEDAAKAIPSKAQVIKTTTAERPRRDSKSTYDFSGENDREKAALAELTWLNSLAGVNMSGTTDRVTTSLPAVNSSKRDGTARIPKSSLVTARRKSTTSQTSTSSKVKEAPSSPPSVSNESDSTRKSGESSGLFSLVSTATSTVDTESIADDERDSRRRSGQSKTRNAALAAVFEKEEALKDSRFINIEAAKIPMHDVSNGLVKVMEVSGEHDEEAWGL